VFKEGDSSNNFYLLIEGFAEAIKEIDGGLFYIIRKQNG